MSVWVQNSFQWFGGLEGSRWSRWFDRLLLAGGLDGMLWWRGERLSPGQIARWMCRNFTPGGQRCRRTHACKMPQTPTLYQHTHTRTHARALAHAHARTCTRTCTHAPGSPSTTTAPCRYATSKNGAVSFHRRGHCRRCCGSAPSPSWESIKCGPGWRCACPCGCRLTTAGCSLGPSQTMAKSLPVSTLRPSCWQ